MHFQQFGLSFVRGIPNWTCSLRGQDRLVVKMSGHIVADKERLASFIYPHSYLFFVRKKGWRSSSNRVWLPPNRQPVFSFANQRA